MKDNLNGKLNEINTIKDILLGEDIARINKDVEKQQNKLIELNDILSNSLDDKTKALSDQVKSLEIKLNSQIKELENKVDLIKKELQESISSTNISTKSELGELLIQMGTALSK